MSKAKGTQLLPEPTLVKMMDSGFPEETGLVLGEVEPPKGPLELGSIAGRSLASETEPVGR